MHPLTTQAKVTFQSSSKTVSYFNFLPSTYITSCYFSYIFHMYIPIHIFLYCDSTEPVLGVDLLLYAQDTQYLAHVSHNKFCDKSTPIWGSLLEI